MELKPGDSAPNFELPDQDGKTVRLADRLGSKLLLYFYPKDDTAGCTAEACQFNAALPDFGQQGVQVIGVSADDAASHQRFRAKFGLEFPLLTDDGNAVGRAYGAFGEKNLYGRTVEGVIRSTFLIDEKGEIEKTWYGVRADGHAAAVLSEL